MRAILFGIGSSLLIAAILLGFPGLTQATSVSFTYYASLGALAPAAVLNPTSPSMYLPGDTSATIIVCAIIWFFLGGGVSLLFKKGSTALFFWPVAYIAAGFIAFAVKTIFAR